MQDKTAYRAFIPVFLEWPDFKAAPTLWQTPSRRFGRLLPPHFGLSSVDSVAGLAGPGAEVKRSVRFGRFASVGSLAFAPAAPASVEESLRSTHAVDICLIVVDKEVAPVTS